MWAFAIYDLKENFLFCSRDRFGVKPFNYTICDDQFIFASEIKSILQYKPELKKPNYNIISNFCRTSIGAQHKETWFENILRLQPGNNLTIKEGDIKIYRYWNYPSCTDNEITFEEAKSKYLELFTDAVKLRMRSDVAVGTTLSSGIDSSSIVSVLRKFYQNTHHTYTATFRKEDYQKEEKSIYSDQSIEIDESTIVKKFASQISLNAHFVEIEYGEFVDELAEVIFHLESGNSSPAVLPLFKVMKAAKEEVTVVLEGQGADELLGGYALTLGLPTLFQQLKQLKIFSAIENLSSFRKYFSLSAGIQIYFRHLSNTHPFISKLQLWFNGTEKVFGSNLKHYSHVKDYPHVENGITDPLNKLLMQQHSGGLVNLLHYGDSISMAHSLESRLPFMDYRLVEFSFKLPWKFKYKNGTGKFIHREALKGIVPLFILENNIKFGFTTPISKVFLSEDSAAIQLLIESRTIERGLFNKQGLNEIIKSHIAKKKNHSTFLFRLVCVELWFRIFIDK
jgi:asparagine synthase (glutamine-hydrolysing)